MKLPQSLGTKSLSLMVAALLVPTVYADEQLQLEKIIIDDDYAQGYGLLTSQTKPHARSVISKQAIEQKSTLNNAYQAMDLLPGVNTFSHDASGLFGGGLRIRGFNSDQIGISIDGVPMNDAGNFAVYASELVDLENLQSLTVMQGGSDIDAPMVGSVGGSVGLATTQPLDEMRFRVQQSYGTENAFKTFLRADTGYLGDKRFKAFISVSKAKSDKWKGVGEANREHLDFKGVFNISPKHSITGSVLYNRLFNNNLRKLSLAQIETLGRKADFGAERPQHLTPENGTAQIEQRPADGYYNLNLNPYRNYLFTLQGRFQVQDNLRIDIDPYYSYGYGTGGNQLRTLTESNTTDCLFNFTVFKHKHWRFAS